MRIEQKMKISRKIPELYKERLEQVIFLDYLAIPHLLHNASIEKNVQVESEEVVTNDNIHVKWLDLDEQESKQGALWAAQLDFKLVLDVLESRLQVIWKCASGWLGEGTEVALVEVFGGVALPFECGWHGCLCHK